jgi:hypothetical protein
MITADKPQNFAGELSIVAYYALGTCSMSTTLPCPKSANLEHNKITG